ncbi:hypothetical protein G9A89_006065 [Geosiphon pyriformis]|nr:hypothetical protein G9A89_006065 [Geosiphon pyriformis]
MYIFEIISTPFLAFHVYKIFVLSLFITTSSYALYTPGARFAHTANLIDSKIYFQGGTFSGKEFYGDFFYADLAGNFTPSSDSFTSIDKNGTGNPGISWGTSVTTKDGEILVFGGVKKDDSGNITLAKGLFNIDFPSNRSWNVIDVSGNTAPDSRRNFQAVINSVDEIFVFGGSSQKSTLATRGNLDYQMYKYNTRKDFWVKTPWNNPKNIDTSTLPGFDFTATFLEDDTTIIFIGGRKPNGKLMEMNQLWLYNTQRGEWSSQNVSGDTIKPRAAHSAVLAKNPNRIIVYGGIGDSSLDTQDSLAVLDINSWTWSNPSVNNNNLPVPLYHTATYFTEYMIVTFGCAPAGNTYQPIVKNLISILDTSNNTYKWVKKYTVRSNSTTNQKPQVTITNTILNRQRQKASPSKIGGTVGGVLLLIIVCFIVFFYCRKKQEKDVHDPEKPLRNSRAFNISSPFMGKRFSSSTPSRPLRQISQYSKGYEGSIAGSFDSQDLNDIYHKAPPVITTTSVAGPRITELPPAHSKDFFDPDFGTDSLVTSNSAESFHHAL